MIGRLGEVITEPAAGEGDCFFGGLAEGSAYGGYPGTAAGEYRVKVSGAGGVAVGAAVARGYEDRDASGAELGEEVAD